MFFSSSIILIETAILISEFIPSYYMVKTVNQSSNYCKSIHCTSSQFTLFFFFSHPSEISFQIQTPASSAYKLLFWALPQWWLDAPWSCLSFHNFLI